MIRLNFIHIMAKVPCFLSLTANKLYIYFKPQTVGSKGKQYIKNELFHIIIIMYIYVWSKVCF